MFQGIVKYWQELVNTGDQRSNELPFVKDPTVVICAAIVYLLVVKIGPFFMEKPNGLQLRQILIGYNLFSVVFSAWMMWEFFACSFLNKDFNLFCQDVDENDTSPLMMRLVRTHWWYFFSKFIEFFDTFFFVLRKKNNQISFLHVYHHVSMLMLQWILVKFAPGGVSFFGPLLNCFIHALMYTYYMLSAFGPHMQKYLWWKKYLTKMQMLQFLFVLVHTSTAISCTVTFSRPLMWLQWVYMVTLFGLFMKWYLNAYLTKRKEN